MKHLLSCLHPVKIKDVNGRTQYVPCGKCDACRRMQASVWVQRLEQESRCWKHTLFFSLTYSDEFLPKLKRLDESIWCDTQRIHHGDRFPFVTFNDFIKASLRGVPKEKQSFVENEVVHELETKEFIPYLPVADIQKFLKRLRSNLQRKYDKDKKTNSFRYYIVGEYGPKHLRPHWHGLLWSNSDELSSNIASLLSQTWKFGYFDASPVQNSASQYVAKYINCFTHLPSFYKEQTLRPYAIFSKCPPIGSLVVPASQVRKMFFDASPKFALRDPVKSAFALVNLWNFYKNRLFPKVKGFDKFSHNERVVLYRFVEQEFPFDPSLEDAQAFVSWYNNGSDVSSLLGSRLSPFVRDYVAYLCDSPNPLQSIYRWFLISKRVIYQASQFGVSVRDYVSQIELFYQNCQKASLKGQLQFESEYVKDRPLVHLIGIDLEFFLHFVNLPRSLVTRYEEIILSNYGIDLDKFFSDDSRVRALYINSVNPYLTADYAEYYQDSLIYYKHSNRVREKNEELNPALSLGLADGVF